MTAFHEIPPTAGLPVRLRDLAFACRTSKSLEATLAEFLGTPEVQVECSGTACLYIALETLKKLSDRRVVIISAYTCPLVVLAILRAGLVPAACDTLPDSYNFNPDELRKLCSEKTLCIIASHLAGTTSDLTSVIDAAKSSGAFLIEDAAQALGSKRGGRPAGLFGDIGFYSLACGKGLTMYEGGVLVAANEKLRNLLKETSRVLVKSDFLFESVRIIQLIGFALLYNPFGLWFTYGAKLRYWLRREDPVKAIGDFFSPSFPLHKPSLWRKNVAARSCARLAKWHVDSIAQAARVLPRLSALPGCILHTGGEGTYPFFMVTLKTREVCQNILKRLWEKGCGVSRLFIHSLPNYEYLKANAELTKCPNAESYAERTLTISNAPSMNEALLSSIINVIEEESA